jgi:aminoglycoside phosphotransferase (APT) family kinase protein
MSTLLSFPEASEIVERSQLTGAAEALSGARFERVVLGDGRRLVLKHLPPDGDWLTRFTAGAHRLRLLWDSGTLAQVATAVDHTIVAVVPSNGADVVVMRDVSDSLLPTGSTVSLPQIRQLVAGLAELHRTWQGHQMDGLCPPEARYRLFAPRLHAADDGPNRHPARENILAGWRSFAELVPTDVADAVFAVHQRPELLAAALMASAPATLVHGDAKLENLGACANRLVAIDWGELTGIGPAEIDVAWLAVMSGWRMDVLPDEVFAAYGQQADRRLDPRALDLACIGSLAQMGFKLAARCRAADQPTRDRAALLLDWWVTRVRVALTAWSPA